MGIFDIFKRNNKVAKKTLKDNRDNKWIDNGWSIATKLLSALKPEIIPCVSKDPTMVFDDKFMIFYAFDLTKEPKQEFWIITGSFPPALIDASKTENERDAITLFGEIYQHDGRMIQGKITGEFILPVFTTEGKRDDKEFGVYIENIGNYLCKMAETFPWDKYGIKGKVFSVG